MAVPKQTFYVSPEQNYRPIQVDLYEQRSGARELALFSIPHIVILDELDNICTDVVAMKAEDKVLDVHPIDDRLVNLGKQLTCPISLLSDSDIIFIDIKVVIWSRILIEVVDKEKRGGKATKHWQTGLFSAKRSRVHIVPPPASAFVNATRLIRQPICLMGLILI